MNSAEIEARIRDALRDAGIDQQQAVVRIQPDPYHGWNIAVISQGFTAKPATERRRMLAQALEHVDVAWLDALTPTDVEWAGPLPGDTPSEELPFWPEALARAPASSEARVKLVSDLDHDLPPPIVATFYALRGGVGRSTALAQTAHILAARRKKVVCVDMDLEAPALPVLLGCSTPPIRDDQGVVDLLMALDQGEAPDFASHLLQVPETDGLFVLPAGRVSANYARKLRFVNPLAWYREDVNPLRRLIDGLRSKLPFRPDAILLDARTGITDLSGPLLFDLADIAVIVFYPHPQARTGTELLARSLLRTTSRREMGDEGPVVPEVRFLVSPVPTSSAPEVRRRYEQRAFEWIDEWLEPFNVARASAGLETITSQDIVHVVPYREDIATSDAVAGTGAASAAFEPVADWLQRFLSTTEEVKSATLPRATKAAILKELDFADGTAEEQDRLLEDFVQTDRVDDALMANVPLVLGRKGTGKTAIFRYLSERAETRTVVIHAPSRLRGKSHWQLSSDGFASAEAALRASGLGWRHFWTLYAAVALSKSDSAVAVERPAFLDGCNLDTEFDLVDAVKRTAASEDGRLELSAWLRRLDAAFTPDTLMLFDGLDTGFGSIEDERRRRRQSVEGLFDGWMDVGQGLLNLRFKIMLREDIWRQLNFTNKSHLFGKTVTLKWSAQTSFLRVIIKQAMRSESFRNLAPVARLPREDVDYWSDDDVFRAWSQLVGERMKGGQTAYTSNWVWNRLADANADHAPRQLLQLFSEAVRWERMEEARSPYEKTVIRPRALTACLDTVSSQALQALGEEFSELEPLLRALEQAARTPVDANTLAPHDNLVPLAREVGLLGVYEETGEIVNRYKVPDLYRHGLRMTRRGPG